MAIKRKPKTEVLEEFIGRAPDAPSPSADLPGHEGVKGVFKGHKRQITLTIAPKLLQGVDALAKRTGQTRAALINLAIWRMLNNEL